MTRTARAAGALYGLAIGDALGMPTQSLPRALIVSRYGEVLDGFHPAPSDQPLAAGMPAGAITDDTEQAVLLGELVVASGGKVDGHELARRLLAWEDSMRARGSLDLLGPSTKRAIDELLAGTAIDRHRPLRHHQRRRHAHHPRRHRNLRLILRGCCSTGWWRRVRRPTTPGSPCRPPRPSPPRSVPASTARLSPRRSRVAIRAASEAAGCGHWVAGADVATRIKWAVSLMAPPLNDMAPGTTPPRPGAVSALLYDLVGTSLASQESVPAAFAVLAAYPDDPWLVCRLAASVGGDTDTIAAIAGAVAGACHGVDAFPADARRTVAEVNGLRLDDLAARLLEVRDA